MRKAGVFVLFIFALFLWRLGYQTGKPLAEGVTLHCAIPLAAADYERMAQREVRTGFPTPLTLWTQREHQKVSSAGRETYAAAILARGDVRLLFPGALAEDDSGGALIDRGTAIALFGREDAAGAEIECMDKKRVIRAVIDVALPTVVVMVEATDKISLENVSFHDAGQWETFALRHGLDVALAFKNDTWWELAEFFCFLPAVYLFLWMVFVLAGSAIRCRYPVRKALLLIGLMALVTLGILWVLSVLPQRWIPPRWSDFGFWNGAINGWKQEMLELFAAKIYRPHLAVLIQTGRSAVLGILSFILLLMALKEIRAH